MDFRTFKEIFQKETVFEKPNNVNTKPGVSICIQTYNQEKYLRKCIESVLEQNTNFDIEILLADDGSTDDTINICNEYADNHPNLIRFFQHSRQNNIKVLGNHTATFISLYNLFSARGKFIAICEGDDHWGDPIKLQKQFDFMIQNPEYSICYHSFMAVDYTGNYLNTNLVSPLKKDLESKELIFPWTHPSTLTIFFKNILNEIPREAADVLTLDSFLYSILGNYGHGKYLNNISPSYYRLQENGIWGKKDLEYKLVNKINTYNKIAKYYKRTKRPNFSRVFSNRILKLRLYLFTYHIKKFSLKKPLKKITD